MFHTARHPLSIVSVLVIGLAGCAASPGSPGDETDTANGGDTNGSDGLVIEERSSDHVAGTFAREGASIAFDLRADGRSRHAVITTASGNQLVETTFEDGIESASLLGGRLLVSGDPSDVQPRYEGDQHVVEELAAMPEAKLVLPLKSALKVARVDAALFTLHPETSDDGIKPLDLVTWTRLDARQSLRVPTWSFWGVTRIRLLNETPGGLTASITTFNGIRGHYPLGGHEMREVSGQWWGIPVTVRNEMYWIGMGLYVRAY